MGGHGALYLALRNPQTFQIAGSMSGGVDIRPFTKSWDLPLRLGNYETHPENWEDNSVVVIAEQADPEGYSLIIDCGTEDFFLDVNRDLQITLEDRGFKYEYSEREGAHNWPYWRESILRHLEFFKEEFSTPD
jgi:S-formylglutathione hydrolase FrmB